MPLLLRPISFILSAIHYLLFGLILVVFHVLQWLALHLGGYTAHKKVVDGLNLCTLLNMLVIGARPTLQNTQNLPLGRPIIFVSNHQSLYDIPGVGWFFRKHHVKYVSKKSLGSGIPAISYNLKHGGSVLIDRKKPQEAVRALQKFGQYIAKNNYAVLIFPEGTRSKDGKPRRFRKKGLKSLIEHTPNALTVPITINNSWKLLKNGPLQMPLGVRVTWLVHPPMEITPDNFEEQFGLLEKTITDAIIAPE